jgi:hypothetical protein
LGEFSASIFKAEISPSWNVGKLYRKGGQLEWGIGKALKILTFKEGSERETIFRERKDMGVN